jgi:hypothetical protein
VLESEKPGSQLAALNRLEKRAVIPSAGAWFALREPRNSLSHAYPATEAERAGRPRGPGPHPGAPSALESLRAHCMADPRLDLPAA